MAVEKLRLSKSTETKLCQEALQSTFLGHLDTKFGGRKWLIGMESDFFQQRTVILVRGVIVCNPVGNSLLYRKRRLKLLAVDGKRE